MHHFSCAFRFALVLACTLCFTIIGLADTWLKTITDIQPKSSIRTSDGGTLIAGYSGLGQGGYYAAMLCRLDSQGAVLWRQIYGGTHNEIFYDVVAIPSGGYLAVGVTDSFPSSATSWCIWLVRIDDAGQIEWQKYATLGYDAAAYSAALAGDGNVVVAGMARPGYDWQSPYDAFLLKITPEGVLQWCKRYGGAGNEHFKRVVPYGAGFAALGALKDSGAGSSFDAWVVGLDNDGAVLWQKRFGTTKDDYGLDLLATLDGGLLLSARNPLGSAGGWDAWLIKMDSSLFVEWQDTYGGFQSEEADRLVETSDGYVTAGVETSWPQPLPYYSGDPKLWMFKVDGAGCLLWQRAYRYRDTYGSLHSTVGLMTCPDGGFLVTDYHTPFRSACGGAELVKLDADGALGSPCLSDVVTPATASATTTGADASVPATAVTLTLKDSTAGSQTFQSEMKECNPGQVQEPIGQPVITAEDVDDCADTGVRITWPADPDDWGDGGVGMRTYDVMVNGYSGLQTCLPYGTTSYVDTSGTNNQTYAYWIRYSNGADLTLESQAAQGTDVVSYPATPTNPQAADNDLYRATGVDISWTAPEDWGDAGRDPTLRGFKVTRNSVDISDLLPVSTLTFLDTTGPINPSFPNMYQIIAVNACGNQSQTDYIQAADYASPPGEVSGEGHPMTASKAGGASIELTFFPGACISGSAVYWGQWDPNNPWLNWTGASCLAGTAHNAMFDPGDPPPGTFFYFVVAANNGSAEGSYGQDSANVERHHAYIERPCNYPQDLGTGCPY